MSVCVWLLQYTTEWKAAEKNINESRAHTHTPNGLDWERKLGDQSNGKHEHAEKRCEKAKEKAEKPAKESVSERERRRHDIKNKKIQKSRTIFEEAACSNNKYLREKTQC